MYFYLRLSCSLFPFYGPGERLRETTFPRMLCVASRHAFPLGRSLVKTRVKKSDVVESLKSTAAARLGEWKGYKAKRGKKSQ